MLPNGTVREDWRVRAVTWGQHDKALGLSKSSLDGTIFYMGALSPFLRATSSALGLLTMSVVAGQAANGTADFSLQGPCSTTSWQQTLHLPPELHATLTNTLDLNITIPSCDGSKGLPPFPVLIFFNGFQARTSHYHLLVQRVSSWGFVVAQYNTPFLRIFYDTAELKAFEPLVDWLVGQNDKQGSPLYGLLDMDQLVVGGHSRGAKLATLVFAERPDIRAAYLVDPVDNTKQSPESPEFPSAAKALAACGREVGITGAGLVGSCNPEGSNYKMFWAVAVNGSWLSVIPGASHSQWMDAGCILNKGLDLLCGRGKLGRRAINELTAAPMLAWLYKELKAPDAGKDGQPWPPPLQAFFGWSKAQEEAGRLQFDIKEREVPEAVPSSNDAGVVEGEEGDEEELCGVDGGPPGVYALRK